MKVLEYLQGIGTVTAPDGDKIRATYDVHITQDESQGEPGVLPIVRSKHISGLVLSTHNRYFVPTHFRTIMTLEMDDGRKFQFFYRDIDGNIGLTKWIG